MYRAKLSVAMGPSVCARKSLSLIHRQKLASGSNYDRACVRAHSASWHVRRSVGQAASTCTPPKRGPRRRRETDCTITFTDAHSFLSFFIKILISFIHGSNDKKFSKYSLNTISNDKNIHSSSIYEFYSSTMRLWITTFLSVNTECVSQWTFGIEEGFCSSSARGTR